ncbi:MAG: phosphoenolpyruvate mutase [Xanthomonadales bacterium]|nr:phosphoenolpyruvate mutase [Gammaproteobacteria bacterium]MBT8053611.1 phosphoenolpyruvate mutase [Gammaproteobacteria bacterium]NND58611.1 phosphoenolpyruvate mutase [Xanthomonadales bacterium]NNK50999.1 phosphoenolpyruvate mutase [Xanthomonadales bacterium]
MEMNKPKKTARLKNLLQSDQTEFILEAHNGLSAKIVEEAGFSGIWASGLALSAQHAVRDNNELSWTQVVNMLEFMSDATSIPILLDGDTGYGDFNNMRRLVRKLEQRDVAGVCIEDKLFPKTNSFIQGERQELEDVETFCGKIKAGKDAQSDDDFCIVARVEAFIAGWGLDEAIRRGEAYRQAGANAILIHSKMSQPDEILEFTREWDNRCPLVIVPTKYYSTPTEVFRQHRISLVIWANHLIRANIAAMQNTARTIHDSQSLVDVEGRVATVPEIFRLQGAEELLEAEKIYARSARPDASAIILAASRGRGLDELTLSRPKVMIPVAGKTVLRRQVDKFKAQGINDITVVGGYHSEAIDEQGVKVAVNDDWESSDELVSLSCAVESVADDTVLIYGDLLFRSYILNTLMDWDAELLVVVDSSPLDEAQGNKNDLAYCSAPDDRAMYQQKVTLAQVSSARDWGGRKPDGRWIGMLRASGAGKAQLLDSLDQLRAEDGFAGLAVPDLLNRLVRNGHKPQVQYISGHWMDINNLNDLQRAGDFAHHNDS